MAGDGISTAPSTQTSYLPKEMSCTEVCTSSRRRDEAGLDESEGVPWLYEKKYYQCMRINPDGSETGQMVPCMTYVDVQRPDEGAIMPDYIIWINKAIREAKPFGLPDDYVEKYIRPYIPPTYKEEEEQEIQMVRVMAPRRAVEANNRTGSMVR